MKDHWIHNPCPATDSVVREAALRRQAQLTKPAGSLGRLEDLAVSLAAMQGTQQPSLDRVRIAVFVADHGVAARGVSAFPQAVTGEMVKNFAAGGAAISVLAGSLGAELEVINLGTINDPGPLAGVVYSPIAPSTVDFTQVAAMSTEQMEQALLAGAAAVERGLAAGAQLLIGGDMGIGNTTAATALGCALLRQEPMALAGAGTGLDEVGISRKVAVIAEGLVLHRPYLANPLEALRRLGGFEIAALAGFYIRSAQAGLPVLVDGFIATSAALAAVSINPGCRDRLLFAHASAEPGHRFMVDALDARPLLDLGMRLGEGSGAAIALPLLRLACKLHNEMATFAEAAVSGKER
ncbi:MAG: nicotinate-nucleotide--dimethylbenzimidazole phosphoribosyltransferase [Gammaproteobacteria bacterium]|nr:nicotinate-nucleotide--dimethylbenzimidazole phosphoribosyltransferase [Gammaproteobacteria bacterium]MBU1656252.1 nicotinate-nucleotide--dimethylbenzimidazole phosphoribosyltransferase [Gammaproteobacteria bacterium]MBU1959817.1 nicotinate-nucleotide--dimethylbenzimidazole phosphoribosyltransferase [Gammaproteobacteria bacterium]